MEQQDWFEDEIKFLRRLLQPGQRVIDIGANYGVYTLSMAKTVGPTGHVYAFEPASSTAELLAQGIAANKFTQIVLERSALSNTCGVAQLTLNDNSELNALVHGEFISNSSETVPLVTLDECLERYDWRDIDFMKIDAEGEEKNILDGGARFFDELSPLIQYEVKAGERVHMELVQNFDELGYDSYRLVPGLDLLVPFDKDSTPDGYLLNLFCCKQDRAKLLAAQGFLLQREEDLPTPQTEKTANRDTYDWKHTIAKFPYGVQLASLWQLTMNAGNSAEVDEALSSYAMSKDSSLTAADRFSGLEASFNLLKHLCERQPSNLRLSSLARVARDYGARSIAVNALEQLINSILQLNQVEVGEPFLATSERFDTIPAGENIGGWILAAALEESERLGSFSSFYTRSASLQRLEWIRSLGFGSAEMERRLRSITESIRFFFVLES